MYGQRLFSAVQFPINHIVRSLNVTCGVLFSTKRVICSSRPLCCCCRHSNDALRASYVGFFRSELTVIARHCLFLRGLCPSVLRGSTCFISVTLGSCPVLCHSTLSPRSSRLVHRTCRGDHSVLSFCGGVHFTFFDQDGTLCCFVRHHGHGLTHCSGY